LNLKFSQKQIEEFIYRILEDTDPNYFKRKGKTTILPISGITSDLPSIPTLSELSPLTELRKNEETW
jgi:hypothetical protein